MVTIINAAIIYWVLLFAFRLIGRRGPSLMTPFEIILLFMLGGMGMQAILGADHSLTNAILGIATVVMMHVLVSTLKGWSECFGRIVDGTPVIIYSNGCWQEEPMRRLRVHLQDVMAAARGQGVERMEQIKYVIVERNGGISVLKREG
ncbi:MAG TPA: YetF domain-containing protein [Gemmataceae bacterium]|nr:YetF domain-containing protein [Gemmataceae bacterium]